MPPLEFKGCIANFFLEKTDMLKKTFFSPPSPANLRDIEGIFYLSPQAYPMEIIKQEVLKVICRPKADKTSGPDGISNRILKTCFKKLSESLTSLYQACMRLTYHLYAFKITHTIVIKKLGKDAKDYMNSKVYKPKTLLNTLSKTLESIMAETSFILRSSSTYYHTRK